jgi:hypothetical protein
MILELERGELGVGGGGDSIVAFPKKLREYRAQIEQ